MRAVAVLSLGLLLALGGCGSGDDEASAPASASPVAPPSVTEPDPLDPDPVDPGTPGPGEPTGLAASAEDTWSPWSKGGPAPTDLSGVEEPGFSSPTGSIACVFEGADRGTPQVRCDRLEGLGVDEPAPVDCTLDWGDAVGLGVGGGGELLCVGDTVHGITGETDGARQLPYGDAVAYAGLTCTSRESGVQCLTPDRRGFVISRGAIVTR